MKILRVFWMVIVMAGLYVSFVAAEMKGSGYEKKGAVAEESKGSPSKGSGYEEKGSGEVAMEQEHIAVTGNIYFSDDYAIGEKKCAAFLYATEDGALFCVLDKGKAKNLREAMGEDKAKVKVVGLMVQDKSGRYIEVEQYDILGDEEFHKGVGKEEKGSGKEKMCSKKEKKGSEKEKMCPKKEEKGSH